MKRKMMLWTGLIALGVAGLKADNAVVEQYEVDPASIRVDGVPKGEIHAFQFNQSSVFPGTVRDYWVYVPAQYKPEKPACLMVFQDGRNFAKDQGPSKMPIVFDNLIHSGEMPVTIAICVNPGVVPALNDKAQPRYNRSYEYDGMSGDYARFLNEELIPEVSKTYNISSNPNDRGICGSSSGGIAAFNAAWYGNDSFRRVYTMIGTYVGLRGGDALPVLIRKTEPKPLRVFLQDGRNDNNLYGGSWWDMNQAMLSSFQFSGYEVDCVWGEGGHNQKHGGAVFPQAMRYLWKDYPNPVRTHFDQSKSQSLKMLIEGQGWQKVSSGHGLTEGPAVNDKGELFFTDLEHSKIHKVNLKGEVSLFVENSGGANGLAFGPNGDLYGAQRDAAQIVAWNAKGEMRVLASGVKPNDLIVDHKGRVYFTEPRAKKVWMIPPGGEKVMVDECGFGPNGVMLSADQARLFVADYSGRFVYTYQVKEDGTLAYKQPYFHLHIPVDETSSKADGMTVDQSGWLFTATAMGIQVSDQPGRVHLIIPMPAGSEHVTNVTFGGENGDELIATCGDGNVYKRKTRLFGAPAWKAPVQLNKPRL